MSSTSKLNAYVFKNGSTRERKGVAMTNATNKGNKRRNLCLQGNWKGRERLKRAMGSTGRGKEKEKRMKLEFLNGRCGQGLMAEVGSWASGQGSIFLLFFGKNNHIELKTELSR